MPSYKSLCISSTRYKVRDLSKLRETIQRNYGIKYKRGSFKDLIDCPVCNSEKPVDKFHPKEILHMKNHIRSFAWYLIERGNNPKLVDADYVEYLDYTHDLALARDKGKKHPIK